MFFVYSLVSVVLAVIMLTGVMAGVEILFKINLPWS